MNRLVLHDPGLIDAAIVNIDARQLAKDARSDFAEKYGAAGHRVIMAAQDSANGLEVAAVTLLQFDCQAPRDFVAMGRDTDGHVLALPDVQTVRGDAIAQEMGNLPPYSSHLARAMGLSPKLEGAKVSFGLVDVQEVGRQILIRTSRSFSLALDVAPLLKKHTNLFKMTQRGTSGNGSEVLRRASSFPDSRGRACAPSNGRMFTRTPAAPGCVEGFFRSRACSAQCCVRLLRIAPQAARVLSSRFLAGRVRTAARPISGARKVEPSGVLLGSFSE